MTSRWPALAALLAACTGSTGEPATEPFTGAPTTTAGPGAVADVVGVTVSGDPGAYQFAVAIRSDETGCDQYADWWEVLTPSGELVYRRVLTHSHPSEQPFTRDGGPVDAPPDAELVVRAHLHPSGYGGEIHVGSVEGGFTGAPADPGLAPELAVDPPLPESCLF